MKMKRTYMTFYTWIEIIKKCVVHILNVSHDDSDNTVSCCENARGSMTDGRGSLDNGRLEVGCVE